MAGDREAIDGASADVASTKGGSAAGSFLVGFAPWIVYWILVGNTSFLTAVLVALGLSVLNNVKDLVERKPVKILEAGTTAVFAVFLVIALVGEEAFIERWIQPLGNLGFLVIVVASMVIRQPFTIQYAKESTEPELWDTEGFRYVNWFLTSVWAVAMGIMFAVSLIPPIVQGDATMNDGARPLSIVCYWVIPYAVMGLAIIVTVKYPDWFGAVFDDAQAAPPSAPVTPVPASTADDAPAADGVELELDPTDGLLDAPLTGRLSGAPAGAAVGLSATTVDALGHRWRSEATFSTDVDGTVDFGSTPRRGTWSVADARGLVWSMGYASDDGIPDLFVPSVDAFGIAVEVAVEGGPTLTRTLVRRGADPGVSVHEVREPGVVGRLLLPATGGALPGIALFSGSEGGLDSQLSNAALLASHGYAALIVGYFGVEGLPAQLESIPLERLGDGIRWLAGHDRVDPARVAAMAISRGSEGLLAAAAHLDGLPLRGLVAVSPSSLTWEATGEAGSIKGVPAWTVDGTALPAASTVDRKLYDEATVEALRRRGRHDRLHPSLMHLSRAYAPVLDDAEAVAAAAIPVEHIEAPVLLVSGGDDQVWPSRRMAAMVADRRSAAQGQGPHASAADEVVVVEGAGHLMRLGCVPAGVAWTGGIALGGDTAGNAAGDRTLTERTLAFLARCTA